MKSLLRIIPAVFILKILAAPLAPENSYIKDPLLKPDTAKRFSEIFHYTLEICGAFDPQEASDLSHSILELADALGAFPEIPNANRILLQATAATIANAVIEKKVTSGSSADDSSSKNSATPSARASCVLGALRTAFALTSGTSDMFLVSEVERLIESFATKYKVPILYSSLSSPEGYYPYESYGSPEYNEEYYAYVTNSGKNSYEDNEYGPDNGENSYGYEEYPFEYGHNSYEYVEYLSDRPNSYEDEEYLSDYGRNSYENEESDYEDELYSVYDESYPSYSEYQPEVRYRQTPHVQEPNVEYFIDPNEAQKRNHIKEPRFEERSKFVPEEYVLEYYPIKRFESIPINRDELYEPREIERFVPKNFHQG